ncbi:helix-turn-helix domain-containing protein [Streptomyces sp. ISL-96]|nr:helix-turn-helix domain-containing protein [Streptomyces sp. ISL-96]
MTRWVARGCVASCAGQPACGRGNERETLRRRLGQPHCRGLPLPGGEPGGGVGAGPRRRTLAYRIRRFTELTGKNLASTADHTEVWLAVRAAQALGELI